MKKLFVILVLLLGTFSFAQSCQVGKIDHMLKKISKKIASGTVTAFQAGGAFGAKIACKAAYEAGCNVSLDAETAVVGGVGICGSTGFSVMRPVCNKGIGIIAAIIKSQTKTQQNKAKQAMSDYIYRHSRQIAKNICKAVQNAQGRIHNKNTSLIVINDSGYKVKFTVDVRHGIDSSSINDGHHKGVIGNLPVAPRNGFHVKARVFIHPWKQYVFDLYHVHPSRQKVRVYQTRKGDVKFQVLHK